MVKRILPCFLAIIIAFCSIIRPVYASEIDVEQESYEFAYNRLGDTIVLTDDNGLILEVRPNDATTFNAAVAELNISSAGGLMGAGSGTIPAPALGVLSGLLQAGFVVLSVVAVCDIVTDIWDLLSDSSKAELTAIWESGVDSFTLSDSLYEELTHWFDKVFYDDDGSFIASGLTFDPTNLMDYAYTSNIPDSDYTRPEHFDYPLTDYPVSFNGVSLALSLVPSPFGIDGVEHAFKIDNLVTGGSLYYSTEHFLNDTTFPGIDHSTVTVAPPVVQTRTGSSGNVYHQLGFALLIECQSLAGGNRYCSSHLFRYHVAHILEYLGGTAYFLFENTGVSKLDGKVFSEQQYTDVGARPFELTAVFGGEVVTLPASAFETICSADPYTITTVGTTLRPGGVLYLPDDKVLADANTLTHTGASTGVWSDTVSDVLSGSVAGSDSTWTSLWEWLQKIWEAIKAITFADVIAAIQAISFADVIAAVVALPVSIADAIKGVLEFVFVPDLSAVEGLLDTYIDKFGWVREVYIFAREIIGTLNADGSPPRIPINLSASEGSINWGYDGYILDMSWYARYKPTVDSILSGILWIYFLWRLFKRIPDILSGAGIIEENASLPRGYVWSERENKLSRNQKGNGG